MLLAALIHLVFAVIALKVGHAGPGNRRAETVRLRYAPHGHRATVTPSSDADAARIDWSGFDCFIRARQNVLEITSTPILAICRCELLALAIATTCVGLKHKMSL